MRKVSVIFLLSCVIVLSGCSIRQHKKTLSQERCVNQRSQVESNIKETKEPIITALRTDEDRHLIQILYDKTSDSCIYEASATFTFTDNDSICGGMKTYTHKKLYDLTHKKTLIETSACLRQKEYEDILTGLKLQL